MDHDHQSEKAEPEVKDPRAVIAKDITVELCGRLESLLIGDLREAGDEVAALFQKIYRAVDEVLKPSEIRP